MTNFVVAAYASAGITLQPNEVANYLTPYLKNADAPGYFDADGFIQGGNAPDGTMKALRTGSIHWFHIILRISIIYK